jgi:hypothetical protein
MISTGERSTRTREITITIEGNQGRVGFWVSKMRTESYNKRAESRVQITKWVR